MRTYSGLFCVALLLSAWAGVSCAPVDNGSQQSPTTQVAQRSAPPSRNERNQNRQKLPATPLALTAVDLGDAVHPVEKAGAIELAAAKNEWTSFVLQVGPRAASPVGGQFALRIAPLKQSSGGGGGGGGGGGRGGN